MELYNNAAIAEDLPHGISEQCPALCEGLWVSDPQYQASAEANCDFSAGSFQHGINSSPNQLSAVVDSQSPSNPFDEFINYPPQSLTRSLTWTQPSPSPVPQSNPLHCSKCQQKLPNVNTVLRHVAEKHLPAGRPLRAGRPRWPCVAPNCDLDFISDKDLRRHLMDIHLGIKYTCSCGRRNRRDNHLAHIQDPLRKCKSVGPYICVCGATADSNAPIGLGGHLKHVTEAYFTCSCGQRQRSTDHLRHLYHERCSRGTPYVCHCGKKTDSHTDTGLGEHRRHVEEDCPHGPSHGLDGQPRKRGRPPKTNNESTQRGMN